MIAVKPKAFSYLRFSTPERARGRRVRRRTEEAAAYADAHGLDLDGALTFRDMGGVSAVRGANAVEGALADFIRAVDDGAVPPGSFLLVENLGRLSRDEIVPAFNRFSSLLEKGIAVVTLSDGKVHTTDGPDDLPDLMLSLLAMSRAHEESAMKSKRLKAAWRNKRANAAANGKPLTAKAPAWLRLDRDKGAFEIIEERAQVVRRMFDMAARGYGKAAIARRLSAEGVAPFGRAKGWHHSYVQKILDSEAVIGRFQPMRQTVDPDTGKRTRVPDGEPLTDYFPAVLEDAGIFHRVRRQRRTRSTVSGPKGATFSNILSGLVSCIHCGGPMHYVSKGQPPKGQAYLSCDNARRKCLGDDGSLVCDAPSVRYDAVLSSTLNSLESEDIDLHSVIGSGSESDADARRRAHLTDMLDRIDGEITQAREGVRNLLDVLQRNPSSAAEARLSDLERAIEQLQEQREDAEKGLKDAEANAAAREHLAADVLALIQAWNAATHGDDPAALYDLRLRLNAALRRAVRGIAVGKSELVRDWIEREALPFLKREFGTPWPTDTHRQLFQEIVEQATGRGVSMYVSFDGGDGGRHLMVYLDPRRKGHRVGVALWTDEAGDEIRHLSGFIHAG